MLQGMRKAGQGLLGKIVVTILFGFLILSFAVWGIGDIFRGYGRNAVATVGSTEITAETVRNAYQNEIQRLTRQYRQSITPDRARALGVDAQVFGRLVTEAVLDQRATALGLGLSEDAVVRSIIEEPAFQNAAGQFDRAQFDELLRSNGMNEAAFVREQRANLIRQQIAEGLAGGISAPLAMREPLYRFGAERRSANYVVLPVSAAGDIAAPDDAALKTYFEERKASFRAPEYRKLNVLALTPDAVATPAKIADDVARARYEDVKASRFGTPERRKLQQIVFPNEAEVKAASDRIKAGASFGDIAKERNIAPKDLSLGTFSATEVFDAAVREAAFSLPAGGVSQPIAGRFGPTIVRVEAIEPQRLKPYEEVADEVKREIARERARNTIDELHDTIEDQRAAAQPLAEIAPRLGLTVRTVDAVTRTGEDKAGKSLDLTEEEALLAAAFASEVGADTESIRTRDNGYVWFEVAAIESARDRALDEVRESVVKQWRQDEIAKRLSDKARELVARLERGEAFGTVAASVGQPAKTAEGLARNTAKDELTRDAVTQIFATRAGKAGSAALGEDGARAVFQVTAAMLPPFDPQSAEAKGLEEQLELALADDLLTQYVRRLQNEVGVSVNQQALRTALGGTSEY